MKETLTIEKQPTTARLKDEVPATEDIAENPLIEDEVYLFSRMKAPQSEPRPILGVVDRICNGAVRLESCTLDMQTFRLGAELPAEYRFCRRATTFESRQYGEHCILFQCRIYGVPDPQE